MKFQKSMRTKMGSWQCPVCHFIFRNGPLVSYLDLNDYWLTNEHCSDQAKHVRHADPEMFNIELIVNMDNEPLHMLSDSQAFLRMLPKGVLPPKCSKPSLMSLPPSSLPKESPQPPV